MSDMVDDFRALKEYRRKRRAKFGIPCPLCIRGEPKRQPTILEPGQSCRVHRPRYVDPRPELTQEDINEL